MVTDHCGSSNKNTAASQSISFIGFFLVLNMLCVYFISVQHLCFSKR